MIAMPACINMTDVTRRYGSTVAVGNLSLEVQTGEIMGLLGPNGAGKSTTMKMLCGLVRPTSGTITVFGRDIRRQYLDAARRMGAVLEHPVFFDYLSLRRNLRLQSRLAGHPINVDRALDVAGILHLGNRKAGSLSWGETRRFALAQAMLSEPELLILDEPAAGLDVESAWEMLRLLRDLADRARVTILFASHQLQEVEMLCDRVAIMNEGRLLACEKTGDVLSYDPRQVEVLLAEGLESAARRLSEQDWVKEAELKAGRLFVRLNEDNVHQLIMFLVNNGYQIDGILPRRRSLNDYFLKVLNR
jgi:ABC-type multidrug transport system ATPase subunit